MTAHFSYSFSEDFCCVKCIKTFLINCYIWLLLNECSLILTTLRHYNFISQTCEKVGSDFRFCLLLFTLLQPLQLANRSWHGHIMAQKSDNKWNPIFNLISRLYLPWRASLFNFLQLYLHSSMCTCQSTVSLKHELWAVQSLANRIK